VEDVQLMGSQAGQWGVGESGSSCDECLHDRGVDHRAAGVDLAERARELLGRADDRHDVDLAGVLEQTGGSHADQVVVLGDDRPGGG
jgi:hypothetical protein